jgi:hypothetical protein
MFRNLANNVGGPQALMALSPLQLTGLLEQQWTQRRNAFPPWDHLIYAYMVENTRIYEIFRLVLHEFLHGEKLGSATIASQQWLRNTEELFYRDPVPFFTSGIGSHIRSDLRASRRNAYWRMFGMDLNHGRDDGQPYSYIRPEAANGAFVATFEEFLREVWVGMMHVGATAAPRPTDDAKIATLAERLHEMLGSRRLFGNLSREEFAFVSMMSWFHLTVSTPNLQIIVDLRCNATGAEQRLFKIAQRVGLPAHALSKSLLDIAIPISNILIQIESGTYNTVAAVPALYTPGNAPEPDMRTIITHWSIITGRDIKARPVAAQWKNGQSSSVAVPQKEVMPREPMVTEAARF